MAAVASVEDSEEAVSAEVVLAEEEHPDASAMQVLGPRELTVDGKRYAMKSTVTAKDFIDLIGWKMTTKADGFIYEFEFTDELLARMLSVADPV